MKSKTLAIMAAIAFLLGVAVPAAQAASHATPYTYVYGPDSACALGAGSINDTTSKGGSRTVNRVGCAEANPANPMPPGYLNAQAYVVSLTSPVTYCSGFPSIDSSVTTSAVEITASINYSSSCKTNSKYETTATNGRKSDGTWHYNTRRISWQF